MRAIVLAESGWLVSCRAWNRVSNISDESVVASPGVDATVYLIIGVSVVERFLKDGCINMFPVERVLETSKCFYKQFLLGYPVRPLLFLLS